MSLDLIGPILDTHLASMVDGLDPAPPVAWENRHFDPPARGLYLRPTLLLTPPERSGLMDSPDRLRGIYQVDVCGLAGSGRQPVYEAAQVIRGHFPPGLRLERAGVDLIMETAGISGPGGIDGARYTIPVDVVFTAYLTPA